jgi:hypothetical protein
LPDPLKKLETLEVKLDGNSGGLAGLTYPCIPAPPPATDPPDPPTPPPDWFLPAIYSTILF